MAIPGYPTFGTNMSLQMTSVADTIRVLLSLVSVLKASKFGTGGGVPGPSGGKHQHDDQTADTCGISSAIYEISIWDMGYMEVGVDLQNGVAERRTETVPCMHSECLDGLFSRVRRQQLNLEGSGCIWTSASRQMVQNNELANVFVSRATRPRLSFAPKKMVRSTSVMVMGV
ncbi:hypothetical protein CEP52_008082 [Fusarium oligoseptatum]|uniref:Uncharacterized protein n=1 Tax=Fusarium oligoseptatum TaxID=2604345 RepID=A0A428TJM8_9HYPO|nr:hypothetical protein CEP52_008082 [Fusarium oligoseptatum]